MSMDAVREEIDRELANLRRLRSAKSHGSKMFCEQLSDQGVRTFVKMLAYKLVTEEQYARHLGGFLQCPLRSSDSDCGC